MAELSVDEIAQRALALEILTPTQLEDVWNALGTQNVELDQFLATLLRQGHLTKYQADRLAKGESTGFFYGDYKVLYSAGAGTFARVFRAVNTKTGKTAAVKVLRSRYSDDPEAVDNFRREAEVGMELHHPNIVRIYDYFSDKKTHYIVMDFIEGQTLRQYINVHKKIEYKIATRIVADICTGLDYAFRKSHLHRDMKMTNVLIATSGKALLLDFGLAAETDSKAEQKNQRAIEYAALERSTGVRRDDKRSDIYFLGTMFYQMLSGVAPLGEVKERAQRLNKDRFFNVKPIRQLMPRIPASLSHIVEKSMALDPQRRYQSPGEMLADLKITAKRLENFETDEAAETMSVGAAAHHAPQVKKSAAQSIVWVVETDENLQNSFRNALKGAGYRVLIFSTFRTLFDRLDDPDQKVDCILLNAQSLGKNAVVAFNDLAKIPAAVEKPAILLLDENQRKWDAKTARSRWHTTVGMPITMGRILNVISKLLAEKKDQKKPEEPQASEESFSAFDSTPHLMSPESPAAPPAKKNPSRAGRTRFQPPPKKEEAPRAAQAPAPAKEPHSPHGENASPSPSDSFDGILGNLDEFDKVAIPDVAAPKPKTPPFDQILERDVGAMAEELEKTLAEPSRPAPVPSGRGPLEPYPDDEEFFFDYIDDRDLR